MSVSDEMYDDLVHVFESERLVFRSIQDTEADRAFFMQLANDPISAGMGDRAPLKPASRDTFDVVLRRAATNLLFVVACLKDGNGSGDGKTKTTTKAQMPIGWVALVEAGSERMPLHHHRCAMMAVAVADGYRGEGYGGEMINWTLDWGFRRANLHRVGLGVLSHNTRAERLYRKLGFVEEGRERETTFFDRKWYDTIYFGMLEGDWEKLRGAEAAS
jgi:RimJ/RimL family protein N-acetyltransferase